MDFDAIESRFARVDSGLRVIAHRVRDVLLRHLARLHVRLLAKTCVAVSFRSDRRRSNGRGPFQEIRMRNASHMPQLQEDLTVASMHGVGHRFPASDVSLRVNPRRSDPAVALRRNRRCLTDDQSRARALRVILRHERIRRSLHACSAARQRRHDHAIAQRQVVEHDGIEQRCALRLVGGSHCACGPKRECSGRTDRSLYYPSPRSIAHCSPSRLNTDHVVAACLYRRMIASVS